VAKKSLIAREKKRIRLSNTKLDKRNELRARSLDVNVSFEDRLAAREALQKMPRNSSPSRIQRRCRQCARPRAVYRKFGLCRICLRETLMNGEAAGGRKSSW
jgi:small subunit ribosomal protein S14